MMNMAMNTACAPLASCARSRIRSAAMNSGKAAARPRIANRTMKRTLSSWSANSLAATTSQPEDGGAEGACGAAGVVAAGHRFGGRHAASPAPWSALR